MRRPRIVLTGNVALEVLSSYFPESGCEVMPQDGDLAAFAPDFVYDVTGHDAVLAEEVPGFRDERMARLSGCPYSLDGIRAIVEEFRWERLRGPRKVLAVDADETLWRGVLAEDGAAGIVPHAAFQEGLRRLASEGVVVVVLSKNDPPGSGEPWSALDFVTVSKVDWRPKPENLAAACRELNVSPDAVVFVDDNAAERAEMAAALPEVAVAPFPSDLTHPRQFLRRLREYFFPWAGTTAEDRLRVADYMRQRTFVAAEGVSRESFLSGLGLWVRPSRAGEGDLDRLAQMAGKTNQFNATTRRLTREAFAALLTDATRRVYVFRAGDRFGEQGLVCYVVADLVSRRLTDFVMSCRAMGRTLERFVDDYVTRDLGYRPAIDFVPTAKNGPFAAFLAARGGGRPGFYKEG